MISSRSGSFSGNPMDSGAMNEYIQSSSADYSGGAGSGGSAEIKYDHNAALEGTATPSQLQYIVQELNKILGTTYSLVSFDAKKGRDLIQLLNDFCAFLSPTMKMDLTTEDPQATGQRITDFLCNILNYKGVDNRNRLQNNIVAADEATIYPILYWVLGRMPENSKRVYLAKYLLPLNVPEDMIASDDGVREVFQQYKMLTEQFKEIHKAVERLKAQSNTDEAKASAASLEQDRDLLTQKVESQKKKLAGFSNSEALFKACQLLRSQHNDEQMLKERMVEQLSATKMTDQRIAQGLQRQKELQRDIGDLNINRMMSALQDDINSNLSLLNEKLPKLAEDLRRKVDNVSTVMTSNLDPDLLNRSIYTLEKEVQEIEDKHRPKVAPADEPSLGLFRQQAGLVAGRKEKFVEELNKVLEQKRRLEDELSGKEGELSNHHGSKILRGEEFKQYANSLRGKSTTYKRLKAELVDLKTELGILQRTEEILMQRSEMIDASIMAIEASKGISGYRTVKDNLTHISENKMEVDEAKGKTLEELSKVVTDFVVNIRSKRNKLAPQILELRTTRQKLQSIELECQQRKEIYDNLSAELHDDVGKLQTEVDQLNEECKQQEGFFHRLHSQITILEVALRRAQDEKEFRAGGNKKLSERYRTYAEMFEFQVKELESITRELREKKKTIEESFEQNQQQMRWFKDLQVLLESKISFYKRQASGHVSQGLAGVDMNPLVGVDRLVL